VAVRIQGDEAAPEIQVDRQEQDRQATPGPVGMDRVDVLDEER
jgi:hypothetical protein